MNAIELTGRRHDIKCWPDYFGMCYAGRKTFEVRLNDRDFRVGDIVTLIEYNNGTHVATGRSMQVVVTYVLTDYPEVSTGYCVWSFVPLSALPLSRLLIVLSAALDAAYTGFAMSVVSRRLKHIAGELARLVRVAA